MSIVLTKVGWRPLDEKQETDGYITVLRPGPDEEEACQKKGI
jgi:hypothetical protein